MKFSLPATNCLMKKKKTVHTKQKMKAYLVLGVSLLTIHLALSVRADDTNTVEIIKQFLRRIEELEQKVKLLEASKPAAEKSGDDRTTQQIQALDQKVKILERNRELSEEAAEAKAKETPKVSIGSQGFS